MRFLLSLFLIFPNLCMAATALEGDDSDGLVEVVIQHSYDEPYRDRRPGWSWNLAFQYESLSPELYEDLNGKTFSELFTGEISNSQVVFGPKYNTKMGSFTAEIIMGSGAISSTKSGVYSSLSINKTGIAVSYIADTLMATPYLAPYAQLQLFHWDYAEVGDVFIKNVGTTTWAMATTVGALIQLNWLDESASRKGYVDSGLLNSYLDLYAIQYNPSSDLEDPQLQTAMSLGVGLRVEF